MKKMNKMAFPLFLIGIMGASFYLLKNRKVPSPKSFKVIENFDIMMYLGKWYEIARMDFKYEKNLSNVTASYQQNSHGEITVKNRGYDELKREWKEANGKALFNGKEHQGALKVSFFGPFFSGYNIIAMNPYYENVLIFGEDTRYMWILSRKKEIPVHVKKIFIEIAQKAGYDTDRLTWTQHSDVNNT